LWLTFALLVQAFNLRPTVTGKSNDATGPTANVKVTAILEKANAIRQVFVTTLLLSITDFPYCDWFCILYLISIHLQVVASDDGEDDDNWSDT